MKFLKKYEIFQETESSMYRKLAEEYSKLKAHYQVLKKLLVETRSEKESLTSVLKTKEQDIRKLTQEQVRLRRQHLGSFCAI